MKEHYLDSLRLERNLNSQLIACRIKPMTYSFSVMRAKFLFSMMCALGAVSMPAFAADGATAVAAEKMTAYSVSFSGGG